MLITTSFKTAVVELTRQINHLLLQLGGTGTDINEKSSHIHHLLDEYERRQLRYIASLEHAVVNKKNIKVNGEQQRCIHTCEWMVKRLELHLIAQREHRRNGMLVPIQSRTRCFLESIRPEMGQAAIVHFAMGAGFLCLLILPFLCVKTVEIGEWPYNRAESVTVWPEVIFWVLTAGVSVFFTLQGVSSRPEKSVRMNGGVLPHKRGYNASHRVDQIVG